MNMNSINSHCGKKRNSIAKWLIHRRLRKLKLDEQQKEKLDALFATAGSAIKNHKIVKNGVQESFTAMMAEGELDRDKAAELIRTAADQHVDHATEIAEAFGDLYETLEPWQQQQVQAMWQKRRHCLSHRYH